MTGVLHEQQSYHRGIACVHHICIRSRADAASALHTGVEEDGLVICTCCERASMGESLVDKVRLLMRWKVDMRIYRARFRERADHTPKLAWLCPFGTASEQSTRRRLQSFLTTCDNSIHRLSYHTLTATQTTCASETTRSTR